VQTLIRRALIWTVPERWTSAIRLCAWRSRRWGWWRPTSNGPSRKRNVVTQVIAATTGISPDAIAHHGPLGGSFVRTRKRQRRCRRTEWCNPEGTPRCRPFPWHLVVCCFIAIVAYCCERCFDKNGAARERPQVKGGNAQGGRSPQAASSYCASPTPQVPICNFSAPLLARTPQRSLGIAPRALINNYDEVPCPYENSGMASSEMSPKSTKYPQKAAYRLRPREHPPARPCWTDQCS